MRRYKAQFSKLYAEILMYMHHSPEKLMCNLDTPQALVSNIAKAALSSRSLLEAKSGAVHEVEIGDLSEAATPEGRCANQLLFLCSIGDYL